MKITMSISEMASLAGVAKQINEIVDPNSKKMSVQEMIIKMINNYKDPEKESFCTIKIDHKMNLVIECEPEAISKILDIFKDFILSVYPLYKAAYECGLNFGNRIQEVVDEYDDKKKATTEVAAAVVIVGNKQENKETTKDKSESSFSSELDNHFADIFEDVFKDKEEKSSEEKDDKEEPQKKKSRKSSEVKKNKRYVYCTECGRSSSEELTEDEIKEYTCKHCGSKTFV